MKLAVISSPIFKVPLIGYGGLEALAWQQAKGLAALGHEVSLIAPDGSECPRVTIIPIGVERTVSEKMAFERYWQHLLTVDCVIDNSWNKWAYKLKQDGKMKTPVLGVMHAPINTMIQSPPPVEKPCIVCISQDQANHYQGMFSQEARVCHNGVDMDFYRSLGIKRTNRSLFLARFSTIKGPDLAQEMSQRADTPLDLVGDTSITSEPDYFNACLSRCDGQKIKMIGPANRGQCVWYFSQARVLLHPNQRFREPFGLAPVEAMACQTPVISWNFGAMRETIKPGVSGFLISSVDEGVELLKNGAIESIDRKKCREWAADSFGLSRMVKRYEDLCQEAVQTGGW